ncbi:MAG: hypothetical protein IJK74_08510 [Bacteroidales bacterium]|nr:hypothetical protein [Bacteroidales bacterium]
MKYLLVLTASLFLAVLVNGCGKDSEDSNKPGVYNITDVLISIKDADGNDLLDPNNPDNILSEISLTYSNNNYKLDMSPFSLPNPIAEIYGLRLYYSKDGSRLLWFGNLYFKKTDTFELKLLYSSNEVVIAVSHNISTGKTTFFVNGKEISGTIKLIL